MPKTAILQPPVRVPLMGADGRTLNPVWAGWFQLMHKRVGSEVGAIAVEHGGTGATTVAQAKSALGVPTTAADIGAAPAGPDVDASGNVTATHLATALPVDQGGTGVATLSALLAALGIKYQRVALTQTPSGAQGAYADTAFAWTAAFPDANYTALVLFESNGTFPNARASVAIATQTAAGFTIRLTNVAAVQNSGTAHVIAIHD